MLSQKHIGDTKMTMDNLKMFLKLTKKRCEQYKGLYDGTRAEHLLTREVALTHIDGLYKALEEMQKELATLDNIIRHGKDENVRIFKEGE